MFASLRPFLQLCGTNSLSGRGLWMALACVELSEAMQPSTINTQPPDPQVVCDSPDSSGVQVDGGASLVSCEWMVPFDGGHLQPSISTTSTTCFAWKLHPNSKWATSFRLSRPSARIKIPSKCSSHCAGVDLVPLVGAFMGSGLRPQNLSGQDEEEKRIALGADNL